MLPSEWAGEAHDSAFYEYVANPKKYRPRQRVIFNDSYTLAIKDSKKNSITPGLKYNGEITCRPRDCPPFNNALISGQVY